MRDAAAAAAHMQAEQIPDSEDSRPWCNARMDSRLWCRTGFKNCVGASWETDSGARDAESGMACEEMSGADLYSVSCPQMQTLQTLQMLQMQMLQMQMQMQMLGKDADVDADDTTVCCKNVRFAVA
jgi:hypothetical protein